MRREASRAGFTLVELMIVVMIIGVLAAVAIPAFGRYLTKSRISETQHHIGRMVAGAITYYNTDYMTATGPAPKQFPGPPCMWDDVANSCTPPDAAAWEDGAHCGCEPGGKCPGGLEWFSEGSLANGRAVREALNFALADPHFYKPYYAREGTGIDSFFWAGASGDADCDTIESDFGRWGQVDAEGNVALSPGIEITREFE